jgi:hypothetical protein
MLTWPTTIDRASGTKRLVIKTHHEETIHTVKRTLPCQVYAKPAVYRIVVLNPLFPLAGESVLIPKTDNQAQKQPCAPYWNADQELCLARHRELHAHDNVDVLLLLFRC